MSLPLFIARKYIRSKKNSGFISFISAITIIGIALGVAVLIIAITVLNGFENAVTDKIINLNSHIKITGFGDRNLPSYKNVIPKIQNRLDTNLKSISPFVAKYAVIGSKRFDEGITLLGLHKELDNSNIKKYIVEGEYKFGKTNDLSNLIIGKKLADKLFLKLGSKVTLFGLRGDKPPSLDYPPVIQQFIITGIYESGMSKYDDEIIYSDMKTVQQMFEVGDQVSGYNIQVTDISKVDLLADDLHVFLGYPYYARSIFKVHQSIFSWLELQRKPIPLILGLIIIVAVFNIVGTILMLVLERTKDIGILKSLGARRNSIIKLFIYQGLYLSFIGIAFGNAAAFILSKLQKELEIISIPDSVYFISKVPISIEWEIYFIISAIAFTLCLLASIIPSLIASKISPISAIRFE
ncbi:MAG: ABC transporter permease [Ignavibacteriae bacterium]|nr:ABC transporter permease [Ignavibacteriota bacterium]NOG97483.1 ABC transporter permease [Ignavibacteriota bacterium]